VEKMGFKMGALQQIALIADNHGDGELVSTEQIALTSEADDDGG